MLKTSVISVSISSLKQDVNTQVSGFTVQPVLAGIYLVQCLPAEGTVKEAYSHPLLMRLCTLRASVRNKDPAVCGPSLFGVVEHTESSVSRSVEMHRSSAVCLCFALV